MDLCELVFALLSPHEEFSDFWPDLESFQLAFIVYISDNAVR